MSKKPPFQFNLDPLFSAFWREGGVQELGGGGGRFLDPLFRSVNPTTLIFKKLPSNLS